LASDTESGFCSSSFCFALHGSAVKREGNFGSCGIFQIDWEGAAAFVALSTCRMVGLVSAFFFSIRTWCFVSFHAFSIFPLPGRLLPTPEFQEAPQTPRPPAPRRPSLPSCRCPGCAECMACGCPLPISTACWPACQHVPTSHPSTPPSTPDQYYTCRPRGVASWNSRQTGPGIRSPIMLPSSLARSSEFSLANQLPTRQRLEAANHSCALTFALKRAVAQRAWPVPAVHTVSFAPLVGEDQTIQCSQGPSGLLPPADDPAQYEVICHWYRPAH
jgi:hypothetical protein